MRKWYALTCPVCGFRFQPSKFNPTVKPIRYPVQIVTGGGRAKGFKVVEYLPWSTLPALMKSNLYNSLQCVYDRLAAASDKFYETLGFLSPRMKLLIEELQKSYPDSYIISPFQNYARTYAVQQDITDAYAKQDDYSKVYSYLLSIETQRCV